MTGLLNARRERRVADAVIRDPEEHTVMDEHGAVRSIQAADVTVPAEELDKLWNATNLERLARTYWKYLSRVTLGLIRVTYTEDERAVVLLFRPLVLLRFRAPEYELARDRGRRALADRGRAARLPARARRQRLPRDRRAPPARPRRRAGRPCTSRSRSRASTPRSRPG